MNESGQTRKLAAILAADVAGYSRLMAQDDAATVLALNQCRDVFKMIIETHHGRVVDMAGDSVLAEFASALEAVKCAVEVQERLEKRNAGIPSDRQMQFRIGVNVGDILQQADGTIYGDGVNIAARLESICDPGAITVSGTVYDQVKTRLQLGFNFIGEQTVKNIPEAVRTYRLDGDGNPTQQCGKIAKKPNQKMVLRMSTAATLVALLLGVGGVWYYVESHRHSRAVPSQAVSPDQQGVGIAVLPFENIGGDASQDYFVDGITTELIATLGGFQNLRVAAKHNSFRYKGKTQDIKTVGTELRVRYVLTGSIQRSPEVVRITAQLLQVDSESQVWSQTYQRPLTARTVFNIQQEVSASIAAAIGSRSGVVLRREGLQAQAMPPNSLSAYECFMRWVGAYQRTMTKDGHATVLACLEHAVELDPNYAEAWAALSDVYNDQFRLEYNPGPGDSLERGLRAAERAIQLNPQSQNAYKSLAVNRYLRGEREEFLSAAEHAIQLSPNEPNVLAGLSNYLYYAGYRERALGLLKEALTLDAFPVDWYYFPYFWEHYRVGEYEAALLEARKINMPTFVRAHAVRVAALGQLGRIKEAEQYIQRIRELDPDFEANARVKLGKAIKYDDQLLGLFIEGLRKAGMKISEQKN